MAHSKIYSLKLCLFLLCHIFLNFIFESYISHSDLRFLINFIGAIFLNSWNLRDVDCANANVKPNKLALLNCKLFMLQLLKLMWKYQSILNFYLVQYWCLNEMYVFWTHRHNKVKAHSGIALLILYSFNLGPGKLPDFNKTTLHWNKVFFINTKYKINYHKNKLLINNCILKMSFIKNNKCIRQSRESQHSWEYLRGTQDSKGSYENTYILSFIKYNWYSFVEII